ncbi:MAG: DUF4340 domain-containing protein [Candidatus Methylacidiphilales bacterium]|nr:DUF4340 domain-containing protein [Candidatus Methylacidiphilales bacterium]
MKSWSTFILALVSLVLLAYLYWGGLESPGTKEIQSRQSLVFQIKADEVDRLELAAGESTVVVKRLASGMWEIEKPISYPADLSNVRQLLGDLEFARRRDTLKRRDFQDYDKALETMGLKKPKVRVELRQGREKTTLAIGNETARAGQFYALVSDGSKEEIVIVERSLEESALRELSWFRKREIFEFQTPLVTGVVLHKGEQDVELVRQGDQWTITKPQAGPADETQVISYLADLLAGKVDAFVADGPGDIVGYGLSTPSMVIEIKSGEKTQQLRIGQPVPDKPQVYAQVDGRPHVLALPKIYADKIADLLARTQDRRLLVFQDAFELQSFKVSGKAVASPLALRQSDGRKWNLDSESGRKAENQLVINFLNSLRDARASQLLPKSDAELAKYGLSPAATVFSCTRKSDSGKKDVPAEEYFFSAPRKGKVYAHSSRMPFILELPENIFTLLPVVLSDWFEKRASFVSAPEQLRSVTWQRPAGQVMLERAGEDWPETLGGRPLDKSLWYQMQTLLSGLRVDAWVPVKEADFTRPRFSLVVQPKEGPAQTVDFILMGGDSQEYRGRIRGTREMFVVRGAEPQVLENPPYAAETPAAKGTPAPSPAPPPARP